VSTFQDQESLRSAARTLRNDNVCRAVTRFIRRVFEVYSLRTRIVAIEVLAGSQRADLGSTPGALQNVVRKSLAKVAVGAALDRAVGTRAVTTIEGLSAALHSELTLREGRVQQGTLNEYGFVRLAGMPRVEVFIVPSTEKPGGVGGPGAPAAAPALINRQVRKDGLSSRVYLPPFERIETSAT
jgi:hypothetical protein